MKILDHVPAPTTLSRTCLIFGLVAWTCYASEVGGKKTTPPPKNETKPPADTLTVLSAPTGFWSTVFGHAHDKKNQQLAEENAKLFDDLTAGGGVLWNAFSNNAAFELQVMGTRDALEDKIGEADFARMIIASNWEEFALTTYRRAGIDAATVQNAMEEFNNRLAVRLETLRMAGEVYNAIIKGHAVLQADAQADLSRYAGFLKDLGTNGVPTNSISKQADFSTVGILNFLHSMAGADAVLGKSSGILASNNFADLEQLRKSLKSDTDSAAVLLLAPIASSGLDSNSLRIVSTHVDAMAKLVISNYAVTFCTKDTNWTTVPTLKGFSNACRIVLSNYPITYLKMDSYGGPCEIKANFMQEVTHRTTLQSLYFEPSPHAPHASLALLSANAELAFAAPNGPTAEGNSKDIQQLLVRLADITQQLRDNAHGLSEELAGALTNTAALLNTITNSIGTNGWQYTNVLTLVTNILANTNLFDPSISAKVNSPLLKQAYAQRAAALVETFASDGMQARLAQRKLLLEFFREIATLRVNALQEQNRHLEALVSVLTLETKRWSTISWLHQRYKDEFFYYQGLKTAQDADLDNYLVPDKSVTAPPRSMAMMGLIPSSDTKLDSTRSDAFRSFLAPAISDLQVKAAVDRTSKPHLFSLSTADKEGVVKQSDLVWPSLRLLASNARDQIQKGMGNDPAGKEMVKTHDRLTRATKLVQGYFLIDTYNRRYGQANARFMFREVRQHELQVAALQSRASEPEIRLLLGDQVLFHRAGWNEDYTRQTVGILEAGILAWIGAKQ